MDELLMSRVKQLREIEERLERLMVDDLAFLPTRHAKRLRELWLDVQDMIRRAEAEQEAF